MLNNDREKKDKERGKGNGKDKEETGKIKKITEIGEDKSVRHSSSYHTANKPPFTLVILNRDANLYMINNLDSFLDSYPTRCIIENDNVDKILAYARGYVWIERKLLSGKRCGRVIYDVLCVSDITENLFLWNPVCGRFCSSYASTGKNIYWRKRWGKWRQDSWMVSIERKWLCSAAVGGLCEVGYILGLALRAWTCGTFRDAALGLRWRKYNPWWHIDFKCSSCSLFKSTKEISKWKPLQLIKPYEPIYTDLSERITTRLFSRYEYYIKVIDDAKRFFRIKFLKSKVKTVIVILEFVNWCDHHGPTNMVLQHDSGGENMNEQSSIFLKGKELVSTVPPVYLHELNKVWRKFN